MVCPDGRHKLILHNGDLVCGKCGFVDETDQVVDINEKQTTSKNYNPVNYALLVKIGSQHDYISNANKGLCFELNNKSGKDVQGKRIVPQLNDPYVTGQVVDKGSQALTAYDLFEIEKETNPNLLWPDFIKKLKRIAEEEGEEFEEGKIKAKKPITDDSIYRDAVQKVDEIGVRFGLNAEAVMELRNRVEKNFKALHAYCSDLVFYSALTDVHSEFPGLGLDRHRVIDGISNATCLTDYAKKELMSVGAHMRDRIKVALNICDTGIKVPAR